MATVKWNMNLMWLLSKQKLSWNNRIAVVVIVLTGHVLCSVFELTQVEMGPSCAHTWCSLSLYCSSLYYHFSENDNMHIMDFCGEDWCPSCAVFQTLGSADPHLGHTDQIQIKCTYTISSHQRYNRNLIELCMEAWSGHKLLVHWHWWQKYMVTPTFSSMANISHLHITPCIPLVLTFPRRYADLYGMEYLLELHINNASLLINKLIYGLVTKGCQWKYGCLSKHMWHMSLREWV